MTKNNFLNTRALKLLLIVITFGLTGCLKTRSEISNRENSQQSQKLQQSGDKPTTPIQRQAQQDVQFQSLSASIRQLNGRVEALEYKIQQMTGEESKNGSALDKKLDQLLEQMKIFDQKMATFDARLTRLESKKAASTTSSSSSSIWADAEKNFKNKSWRKAIISYQKYREKNPRGKYWGLATYKIGVSFQELGMVSEAKSFFEEVVSRRQTKTSSYKKAKYRLNALKK